MLKNNSLSERLNAVKKGQQIPKQQKEQIKSTEKSNNNNNENINLAPSTFILAKVLNILDAVMLSLIYGFAIKTIFNLDWKIIGFFSVGFLLHNIISLFYKKD